MAADAAQRRELHDLVAAHVGDVREAASGERAWHLARRDPVDVVIVHTSVAATDQGGLVARLRRFDEAIEVLVVAESAAEGGRALEEGAYDYFVAPVDAGRLQVVVRHVTETAVLRRRQEALRQRLEGGARLGRVVSRDPRMIELLGVLRRLARYRTPILLVGEPGTEKTDVARALHESGAAAGPFVTLDAASAEPADVERTHVEARGGTLFVEDLTAFGPEATAALVALLDADNGARANGETPRLVAACSANAPRRTDNGTARSDLLARLSETQLEIPPLRERRGDIALLAREIVEDLARGGGSPLLGLSTEVEAALKAHEWPGNVQELREILGRAVEAARGNGSCLEMRHLPAALRAHAGTAPGGTTRLLRDVEMEHLKQVLAETRGNKSRAARLLGLSRWALQRKLQKHGIDAESLRSGDGDSHP